MTRMLRFAALPSIALSIAACGTVQRAVTEPTAPPRPPAMPEAFHTKCDASKGQLRPLVVEWDAPDRAALEAQAQKGQLVVRYQGCDLEVLRRCKAPPRNTYAYTAITPKQERVTMKSAEELYANIPVHAAKLEGKLSEHGELSAEMTLVGEYGVGGMPPAVDQLQGDCAGATHVVTALTVGAFSFVAGASADRGVSVSAMGFGAGASRASKNESLSKDGDVAACGASKRGDTAAPEGCGALLRLELAPLLAAGEGIPDCRPGTKLVGRTCKPVDKPSRLSPEDERFVDDKKGFGWGTRCYVHLRTGALPFARAACQRGLEASPDAATKGAILFNYALVEEASGDPVAACGLLSQSLTVRPNKDVQKKADALKCADLLRGS